jgi:hemin uptake protein HemP
MNAEQKDARPEKPTPTYHSRDLFNGGKVVLIIHAGRKYWLRITSAGKLILTA